MRYTLAVLVCFGVVVAYLLIGAGVFGWKHGGGVIPMLILFAAVSAIWRKITKRTTGENVSASDGIEPDKEIVLGVQNQIAAEKKQNILVKQTHTATEASNEEAVRQSILRSDKQNKWIAVAMLVVVFIVIIIVKFSNNPTATRANRIDFVPLQRQRDFSEEIPRIDAIGFSRYGVSCISVGGELAYEGDLINGFKIRKIHSDKVEFEKNGKTIVGIIATTQAIRLDYLLNAERDLSTPSSRLVGHWRNVNNDGELYFSPIEPSLRIGTYRIRNKPYGKVSRFMQFKIVYENSSGTQLVIRPYGENEARLELSLKIERDCRISDVTYTIPKHGQSMIKEYTDSFGRELKVYRYVDDETHPK